MAQLWGTYHAEEYHGVCNGWHIWTVAFATRGNPCAYRWCKSKHRHQTEKWALWQDKNPKARKFENKYYLAREEARVAAFKSAED